MEPILVTLPDDKREALRCVPVAHVGPLLLAMAGILDTDARTQRWHLEAPQSEPEEIKRQRDKAEAKRQRRQLRNLKAKGRAR
jgi:hypothetical protein